MSGPDHFSSADPKTFQKYVKLLKTEKLLGSSVKQVQLEEKVYEKFHVKV